MILSPSSDTTVLFLVVEITTTSYEENYAFLVAAPNTSSGAVTSLVKKPSKTKIPIFAEAALAELIVRHNKLKIINNRFCLIMLTSVFLYLI